MKKIHLVILIAATTLWSSCSVFQSNNSFMKIQQGMTQKEVLTLCKTPRYKRFDNIGEEWEYRDVVSGLWSVVIVSFQDGRVESLDMFKEPTSSTATVPITSTSTIIEVGSASPSYPSLSMEKGDRKVLSDSDFDKFYESVKRGFSSDRIKKIRTVNLTSDQCQKLVGLYTFTDEKIKIMIEMYPLVVDKQNYYKVINMLTFTSEKDEVREAIKRFR